MLGPMSSAIKFENTYIIIFANCTMLFQPVSSRMLETLRSNCCKPLLYARKRVQIEFTTRRGR